MDKAVFLDRDGTLNQDSGYIAKPEDFHLYPFVIEALTKLKKLNYKLFVVTNQSGVARGYYTGKDVDKIHGKLKQLLAKNDIYLDDIFYAPYHKDGIKAPYNVEHPDRKPGLGLFKKCLQKYDIKIKASFMIGDKYSDIAFGKKAHLQTIQVLTGEGWNSFLHQRKTWKYHPDYVVKNLLTASKLIEKLS